MPTRDKLTVILRHFLWRTPLLLPLAVVLGVIVGGSAGWCIIMASLVLAVSLGLRRMACVCFLLGVLLSTILYLRQLQQSRMESSLAQSGSVTLQGVVTRQISGGCIVQTGWMGVRVALRGDTLWQLGDEVSFSATRAHSSSAPLVRGMFSADSWMRGQGVCANLNLLHGVRTGSSHGWFQLVYLAERVRSSLAERLMPPGTESDARRQVLCALVLGEKSRAEADTIETFRRSGSLHAFAVSGLHVGLVSGILWFILRLCRVRPVVGRYIQLGVVGLYVIATGLAVPALRAYFMIAALMLGLMLRRRVNLLNTWCFAALLILFFWPWQLYQAGFQLSFVIYATICLAVRYGMRGRRWFGPNSFIPSRIYTRWERWLSSADVAVRGVVIVSMSAWLVSLPFSIYHFHVVNTASYLANIAISPLLPLVMFCGLATLFFGGLPLLGPLCHSLAVQSAGWFISLAGSMGSFPGAFLPAHAAAPPTAIMAASLGYGKSFAILGNPGLLVGDLRSAADARYTIEPALFHAGFSPAAICGSISPDSLGIYRRSWPALRSLSAPSSLVTPAGRFSIYPTSSSPIIIWQRPNGSRIIYADSVRAKDWASLPADERRAESLFLGAGAEDELPDAALRYISVGELILLPSAASLPTLQIAPTRILRITENRPFFSPSP